MKIRFLYYGCFLCLFLTSITLYAQTRDRDSLSVYLDTSYLTLDTVHSVMSDYENSEEDTNPYQAYIDQGQSRDKRKYEFKSIDNQQWQRLTSDKAFDYQHTKESRQKIKKPMQWNFHFGREIFDILAVLFIIAIFVGIIYIMMGRYYFGKSDKPITYEILEEQQDIHQIQNWDARIRQAIDTGDFRTAFRLRFMESLALLSEKQLIQYHKDSTNYDYLQQIVRADIQKGFQTAALYFDYIWYGMFEINRMQYLAMEQEIIDWQNKIRSV